MSGYDRKTLQLSHGSTGSILMKVQVDVAGDGRWRTWRELAVEAGKGLEIEFPEAFGAYWLRLIADKETTATAQLRYE
jgi:hypothetical protein